MTSSQRTTTTGSDGLPPIPWGFDKTEGGVWLWDTETFRAVVASAGVGYFWEVIHTASAEPVSLLSGSIDTFPAAERAVRETIGKAYPINSGYRRFAGELATTFQLADGKYLDFGPLEHSNVLITVLKPEGGEEVLAGELRVKNFFVTLDAHDKNLLRINPSHISDVRRVNGVKPPTKDSAAPRSRITIGAIVSGCTGKAGFVTGTVDHLGARTCPVHEGQQIA